MEKLNKNNRTIKFFFEHLDKAMKNLEEVKAEVPYSKCWDNETGMIDYMNLLVFEPADDDSDDMVLWIRGDLVSEFTSLFPLDRETVKRLITIWAEKNLKINVDETKVQG